MVPNGVGTSPSMVYRSYIPFHAPSTCSGLHIPRSRELYGIPLPRYPIWEVLDCMDSRISLCRSPCILCSLLFSMYGDAWNAMDLHPFSGGVIPHIQGSPNRSSRRVHPGSMVLAGIPDLTPFEHLRAPWRSPQYRDSLLSSMNTPPWDLWDSWELVSRAPQNGPFQGSHPMRYPGSDPRNTSF